MKQYSFENKNLTIKVAKAPAAVRIVLLILVLMAFLGPLVGFITFIMDGNGLRLSTLIFAGVFWLMGFYLLRIMLWNSYGAETFVISGNHLIYEADYGWFRDARKTLDVSSVVFSMESIGYEDHETGVLIIDDGTTRVTSVAKMPIGELEELIATLKKRGRDQDVD